MTQDPLYRLSLVRWPDLNGLLASPGNVIVLLDYSNWELTSGSLFTDMRSHTH
jgi:hypothetical protein